MSTDKKGDQPGSARIATDRLGMVLDLERSPRRKQGRQEKVLRDETTPNTERERVTFPPSDELTIDAADEILRITGVMGGIDTEVGAPVRDHAQQTLADADTTELSDGYTARVRMAAQKPPEEVRLDFHFHSVGIGNGGRAGLILCIAAVIVAVVMLVTGITLVMRAILNSP